MLLHDTSHVSILRIHALESCISFRYARCTVHGHEAWDVGVEPKDGVGGPIPKMEGPLEYMPE